MYGQRNISRLVCDSRLSLVVEHQKYLRPKFECFRAHTFCVIKLKKCLLGMLI